LGRTSRTSENTDGRDRATSVRKRTRKKKGGDLGTERIPIGRRGDVGGAKRARVPTFRS